VTEDYLNRFGGIARLYGIASLERFSKAHVMVIGLGGVGSWTIEALARSGVGQFTLVDLDDLCLTNTNRQIHATTDTIGQSKAIVLAKRILQINPDRPLSVLSRLSTPKKIPKISFPEPPTLLSMLLTRSEPNVTSSQPAIKKRSLSLRAAARVAELTPPKSG
jgi:tRNA A37 threonylcarbamoyladenosine dehydratase